VDILGELNRILQQLSPAVAALVVPSAGAVSGIVEFIKRRWSLGGNLVQTVAAAVSIVVVTIEAAVSGALAHPDLRTGEAVLLASLIVWLGSIGIKEVVTDRGPSPAPAAAPAAPAAPEDAAQPPAPPGPPPGKDARR
jgi:hypothetical protein